MQLAFILLMMSVILRKFQIITSFSKINVFIIEFNTDLNDKTLFPNDSQYVGDKYYVANADMNMTNLIQTYYNLKLYLNNVIKTFKEDPTQAPQRSYDITGKISSYDGSGFNLFISSQFTK